MKTVLVRAGVGRRVRLEGGDVLVGQTKTAEVQRTIYIEKRLQCGDLVDVTPAPVSISAPAPEAAKIDTPPAAKSEPVKAN